MKYFKNVRTDLALEAFDGFDGVRSVRKDSFCCDAGELTVEEIRVESSGASRRLGKPCGRYVTILSPCAIHELNVHDTFLFSDLLSKELRGFVRDHESVTVVGLGNRNMTVDSIGVKTAEIITATRIPRVREKGISAVIPGTQGSTGVSAEELLNPLLSNLKSPVAVLVDSLAARDVERLGCTVQLSDTGICPGSGLGRRRCDLNSETLGCNVISIGVPTVIAADDLIKAVVGKCEGSTCELILGAVDCDILSEAAARVIALAIEKVFS